MDSEIFRHKTEVLNRIVEKLGTIPLDYREKFEFIRGKRVSDKKWLAAGVLIPLFCRESPRNHEDVDFVFQLIKRSDGVPQGGDLSAPGGMLNPSVDGIIRHFIRAGLPPVMADDAGRLLSKRDRHTARYTALFLANALRESWEELRLNPFNVSFLGALPSYSLTLFTRTIFPVVGLVKRPWEFRPNWEVEKVVEIPLTSFFKQENYAFYTVESADDSHGNKPDNHWTMPCLIQKDTDGNDEILWGATFNIIISFLKVVFDIEPPRIDPRKIIIKKLNRTYLTGNRKT